MIDVNILSLLVFPFMNIPLTRLYHYIEQLCEQTRLGSVIIYRFWPDGSKEFADLTNLHNNYTGMDLVVNPYVFCHDQEPLNYNFYQNISLHCDAGLDLVTKLGCRKQNLRDYPGDIWDHALLLHSEQNSTQIELYKADGFIPVYYWSHAVIARDWFRFAQHVEQKKQINKTFLIYNRAWSGTREYRLKFVESIIKNNLVDHCQTTVSPVDREINQHYEFYKFTNPQWQIDTVLEDHFPINTVSSTYSADFSVSDYQSCDIEVVLETLFDDTRWHLTEKILRPMALAQPFILMGTAGSLTYLRSYGFKTFDQVWDESYDNEKNPARRLQAVIDLMKTIANWTPEERQQKMDLAQSIADYNKQWFFSQEFFDQIINELKHGLQQGFLQLENTNTGGQWLNLTQRLHSLQSWPNIYSPLLNLTQQEWQQATQLARQYLKNS
jgi:hypothetical protein